MAAHSLIEEKLTYKAIGILYEVHNKLGHLYQKKLVTYAKNQNP